MAIRYEKKSLLNNPKFSQISNEIYNVDIDTAAERVAFIASKHIENVKGNVDIFSSPGRIEMIGNHTDHNHGEVLAAAVSVDLLAAVTKTNDNIVTINNPQVDIQGTRIYNGGRDGIYSYSGSLVRIYGSVIENNGIGGTSSRNGIYA